MTQQSSLIQSFRNTHRTPLQRAGDAILLLGAGSLTATLLSLAGVWFYVGSPKRALSGFQTVADVPLLPVAVLALFWCVCLFVIFERQAADPAAARSARGPETRTGRMLVAGLGSLFLAYMAFSLVLPASGLFFFGKDIRVVVRVDKVGITTKRCTFAISAHPSVGKDFELCVSSRVLGQLRPGDGLELGARVWRAHLVPMSTRRLPPDQVWADGRIPPKVAHAMIEYDAAMKHFVGDSQR
ncbi:MAG: hypothetical protein ACRCS0_07900 [Albidovulum sp.]